MTKREFGDLELAILNILNHGGRMTVKEVHQKLGGQDKYNTIMTVMSRLSEKKMLARERMGLQYEYWVISSTPKLPTFIDYFKKKFFGIKTTEMLSYLIDSTEDISNADLLEMEKIIQNAKKKRDNE